MRLLEIYKNYQAPDRGGDKGTQHSYMDVYAEMLKPDADLLEIGVWEGHSLAMFTEYFSGTVIGLDIDLSRNVYGNRAIKCNATDPEQIAQALGDMKFDYIIDDGSHRIEDQKASFSLLWDYLKPNGIYFIEDIVDIPSFEELKNHCNQVNPRFIWEWDLRHIKGRHDDLLLGVQKVE